MTKIMFQGDSITDWYRDDYANPKSLGKGYVLAAAKALGDGYEYFNDAVSGSTSRHMLARHPRPFYEVQPDVLVILIGINDIWRHYDALQYDKVEADEYLRNVTKAIEISRELKPSCKIALIEPFLMPGTSQLLDNGGALFEEFRLIAANELKDLVDLFIPSNAMLNAEYKAGNICSDDGVHLNDNGIQYFGKYVAEELKKIL